MTPGGRSAGSGADSSAGATDPTGQSLAARQRVKTNAPPPSKATRATTPMTTPVPEPRWCETGKAWVDAPPVVPCAAGVVVSVVADEPPAAAGVVVGAGDVGAVVSGVDERVAEVVVGDGAGGGAVLGAVWGVVGGTVGGAVGAGVVAVAPVTTTVPCM